MKSIKINFLQKRYDFVESTNETAKSFVTSGAPEVTAIVASQQAAGKGRHGNTWTSPKGNLYCSIILHPADRGTPLARYGQLAFVVGNAVAKVLKNLSPTLPITLKWPNDVLLDGRKLCGILIEVEGDAAIVGIGMNIQSSPVVSTYATTYLCNHVDKPVEVEEILEQILVLIGEKYESWIENGFDPVRTEWLSHAHHYGETIVRAGIQGRFIGIDDDGRLLIQQSDGIIVKMIS
ncbi:MAG: biotin--[acetyl-CoA-carboxylase] ligase [Alphaproteobacteria bacterium]|nr:biotin--[acetyl-CoA-carboxylase] ligase [Alphaproteobacteria bacterium]